MASLKFLAGAGSIAALLLFAGVVWQDERVGIEGITALSAGSAKEEAARVQRDASLLATRAKEESEGALSDLKLAAKDMRIRKSLQQAAQSQQKSLEQEEARAAGMRREALARRRRMGTLVEALLETRRDMGAAAVGMHGHVLQTEGELAAVQEMQGLRGRVASDLKLLAAGDRQARAELQTSLREVRRASGIMTQGEAARARVGNKARMAWGQARFEADEAKLLGARAKVLKESALAELRQGQPARGRASMAVANEMARKEAAAEKAAGVLAGKAKEAAAYTGLLTQDLAAGERRAQQDRAKFAALEAEYVQGRRMEEGERRKEALIASEERAGVAAVAANEAAFRRDAQRLREDHRALVAGTPKLVALEKAWRGEEAVAEEKKSKEDMDERLFDVDEKQAMLLKRAAWLHQEAARALGSAAAADKGEAGALSMQGQRLSSLAKLDYTDVGDSSRLESLSHRMRL